MISLMVFLIHSTDGVRSVFVFLRKHGKLSSNPYEPPAPDHTPKSERTPRTIRDDLARLPFNFQLAMATFYLPWLLQSEGRISWFGASLRRGRDPDWMVNTLIATVAIFAVLSLAVLIAVWPGGPIRYLLARCSAAMFAIWGGGRGSVQCSAPRFFYCHGRHSDCRPLRSRLPLSSANDQ